jgi:hypothetical protein
MGAARRAPADKTLRRMESEIPAIHLPLPDTDPGDRRHPAFARPPEGDTRSRTADRTRSATPRTASSSAVDPKYVAQFGAHARGAQAELTQDTSEEQPDEDDADRNTTAPKSKTAAPQETVDVVLKRETATVTMPLSETREPNGLIGRLGLALPAIEDAGTAETENIEDDGDLALADAAGIAGRLRPIIPAK